MWLMALSTYDVSNFLIYKNILNKFLIKSINMVSLEGSWNTYGNYAVKKC